MKSESSVFLLDNPRPVAVACAASDTVYYCLHSYLQRFQGLILTACGLGMGSSSSGASGSDGGDDEAGEEEAVTSMSSMSSCALDGRRSSSRRCLLTAR